MVDNPEGSFKQLIHREQVIPIMLNMITKCLYTDNWEVIQQICFAIGNVAFIGDFEELIIAQKGIELVLAAMRKYEQEALMLTDAIFFLKKFCVWREWSIYHHC